MAKKQEEKKKTQEEILQELEKKYGMGKPVQSALRIVSTGSLKLDQAMKIGGTALGKIIEIWGPESSGKSTITLHQIAEYQKAFPERRVALFDYEHSFDPDYARAVGVDVEKLLLYQPNDQESGYDFIISLVEKNLVSCVVIDSQTAAAPKKIIEGEMGDATIGIQARNNSKFCLKIKGLLDMHGVTLFIISQTRDNIGAMMGDSVTTTGGKAIRFYADVRWKVWKIGDKENEQNKTTIDVIKSKVGKPYGKATLNILWGKGFDQLGEILDYAIEFKMVNVAGSWYSYKEWKAQGAESFKELMEETPELLIELYDGVMDVLFPKPSKPVEEVEQLLSDSL